MTAADPGGRRGDGPVQRQRFATSDPDEGAEFVRTQYTAYEPADLHPADYDFAVLSEAIAAPLGSLRIDRLNHPAARGSAEPPAQLTVVSVLSGHWGFDDRGRQVGGVVLVPTWGSCEPVCDDIDVLVSSLEPETVSGVGAELSGLAPTGVRFRGAAPVSPQRARVFAALMAHIKRDLLAHDEMMASPLVRAETVRHLATTIVLTFPNTALDVLIDPRAPGPGGAEPATVRRAAAFIDEHAHEPIGLAEIAAAAGLGARGLQYAFRRHRDTTPLDYLRRARMERVHRDLQTADPTRGDTVAAIAARWGFAHAGRFSLDYRRLYGRSPSHTLRG